MPSALWLLLVLKFRGSVRRVLRHVRTPRGAILFLFGLSVFLLWLGPHLLAFARQPGLDAETPRKLVPLALLGVCLGHLLVSNRQRSVNFTPADVDFLFAGPFTRRSLLVYKIGSSLFGILFGSTVMSIVFLRYVPWWPAAWLGIVMAMLFLQLFSIALSLVIQAATQQAYTRLRKILVLAVGVFLALAVAGAVRRGNFRGTTDILLSLRESAVTGTLLRPLDIFGWLVTAETVSDLLIWTAAALVANGVMLGFVLWIDSNFYEASVAASQRLFRRMQQRHRTGGVWAPRVGVRFNIPRLPYLRGAGPIAWRQATSLLRRAHGLLFMLLVIGVIGVPVMAAQTGGTAGQSVAIISNMVVLLTFVLAQSLTYDFRGDVDFMDGLKGLPLSATAISAGQLAVPVVVMTVVDWLFLAMAAALKTAPQPVLLWIAVFVLPFNLAFFALENALFLWFPARLVSATPGDFHLFGRNLVMAVAKLLGIAVIAAAASAIGALFYLASGRVSLVFLVATWAAAVALACATVPLVAWAFRRYDVSMPVPQ